MALLLLMLLLPLTGIVAREDMTGKSFLFPEASTSSYVTIFPNQDVALDQFSACAHYYTNLSRNFGTFSMATKSNDDAFVIFHLNLETINAAIHNIEKSVRVRPSPSGHWHVCVTWNSDTGIWQMWVNGKSYSRQVSAEGTTIGPGVSILLGQDQDSFGGRLDANQAFQGEISGVSASDYVMTPEEIQKDLCGTYEGNIINWHNLDYKISGNVEVVTLSQCPGPIFTDHIYDPSASCARCSYDTGCSCPAEPSEYPAK